MDPIELVVDILNESLDVPVSTEISTDRQARFVTVTLEGDASTEFLLVPRVSLTCWGLSDRDAHGIAISAVDALRDASLDHPYLSSVDLETLSREMWSKNGQSRYLAVLELAINTDE